MSKALICDNFEGASKMNWTTKKSLMFSWTLNFAPKKGWETIAVMAFLYLWSCQLFPLQHSFFCFFYFLLTWSKALENKRKHSLSCAHLPQQCQPLLWVIKNELCCGIETWFGLVLQKSLHHLNLMRFTFLFVSPLLIFFFLPNSF